VLSPDESTSIARQHIADNGLETLDVEAGFARLSR
jgi:hypothetical protein